MTVYPTIRSPRITVFGGSGFVGRHVVAALAARGFMIRNACRNPNLAVHLQQLGVLGQIQSVAANVRVPWSVERALVDADVAVNLVGILAEGGKQTFEAVQAGGAETIARLCADRDIPVVHVSAIGADERSPSVYARTKAKAEDAVLDHVPGAVIMRPSIVFGPEDDFFNRFAAMSRIAPALPLIGGGRTRFQPVYVRDVGEAVAKAVAGEAKPGTTYELGGPRILTFRECLEEMLEATYRSKPLVSIPFGVAGLMGRVMKHLPGAPLTDDQVTLLRRDNVVSREAIEEGRTLEGLGIKPTALEAILPSYMVQYRPEGQFTRKREEVREEMLDDA